MNALRAESRETDGEVFGTVVLWCAVAYPHPPVCDYCLASLNLQLTAFKFNSQGALQHDGIFVKFWSLSRLFPSARTSHVRNTHEVSEGVHASYVFVDQFLFITGRHKALRLLDQGGASHFVPFYAFVLLSHVMFKSP